MAKNIMFNADDLLGSMEGIPIQPKAAKEEKSASVGSEPESKKADTPKASVSTPKADDVPKKEPVVSAIGEEEGTVSVEDAISQELGSTRGRKGEKLPFIHSSCTKENYDYITMESRRRGLSRAVFLNMIIKDYKDSPKGRAKIDW